MLQRFQCVVYQPTQQISTECRLQQNERKVVSDGDGDDDFKL